MTHYVYRLFDNDDALLYVGCSKAPQTRLSFHQQRKQWGVEIDEMTQDPYDDRIQALAAERAAIATELPRYNRAHHPSPVPGTGRRINYEIPDDLHHQLKVLAAEEHTTLKELIERALRAIVTAKKP